MIPVPQPDFGSIAVGRAAFITLPTRLPASEKKKVLDWLEKFRRGGGLLKDFARHIGRSPETLSRWQEGFEKYGLAGLVDKPTKPKNFGNRVPLWIKVTTQ